MTELGPYEKVGARLVERGYAAIGIIPGTKRPGELRAGEWVGKSKWREEYTRRLPSRFEMQSWSASGAGICVVCGPASKNLVALDIDSDNPHIRAAILAVLPHTDVRKTGAKGETLFFLGTHVKPQTEGGTLSPSWNIGKERILDLIGPGRQTVLPPTIHPDTDEPYRWTGAEALEDVNPSELTELPPDIIARIGDALRPFGWAPERAYTPLAPGSAADADNPWRKLNELALGNLSAWVPALNLYRCKRTATGYEAVADWRASNTGRILEKRKLNLKVDRKGITDFGDGPKGYTALDVVMAAQGCDFDTAYVFLDDRVGEGVEFIDYENAASMVPADPEPETDHDPVTGEVYEPPAETRAEVASASKLEPAVKLARKLENSPEPSLDELAKCDGLVGDIVKWICDSAMFPSAVLSLGTAVTVIGTLLGRRVCGPTKSATHLYVIGLAPTGAGKEWPLSAADRLLIAAGASSHMGPPEFSSGTAIVNHLLEKPLSLCTQDEWGSFLKRLNSPKASGWEQQISKMFREIWGKSFSPYKTPAMAGRSSEICHAPAMSILGMSTPGSFYSALVADDVENGFLNRFMIINTDYSGYPVDPLVSQEVPESIARRLSEIYEWTDGDLAGVRANDRTILPAPHIIDWTGGRGGRAHKTWVALTHQIVDERKTNTEMAEVMNRVAEMAIRLATIRAVGRWGVDCKGVDVADVEWGRDVAYQCAAESGTKALTSMNIELTNAQIQAKIVRMLRANGRTHESVICGAVMSSLRSTKDLENALGVLAKANTIKKVLVRPPAGGTADVYYEAVPWLRLVS